MSRKVVSREDLIAGQVLLSVWKKMISVPQFFEMMGCCVVGIWGCGRG